MVNRKVMQLDRHLIRKSFSKAAKTYAEHAVVDAEIQQRLIERLEVVKKTPEVVLDLGCGLATSLSSIKQLWPECQVVGMDVALPMLKQGKVDELVESGGHRLCGDAHAIPLASESVDVIFSNFLLPWILNLDLGFSEMRRILKPDGMIVLSTFGLDTLHELKQSAWEVDGQAHVNDFMEIREIGDRMLAVGFLNPVLDIDRLTLTYSNVSGLLKDLKLTGNGNMRKDRQQTLTAKGFIPKLEERYETYRENGMLPATYEIVYAMAWSPAPGQPWKVDGMDVAHISPENIKIRKNTS